MGFSIKAYQLVAVIFVFMASFEIRGNPLLENPRSLTTENQLPEFFEQTIEPFWQEHAQLGEFSGVDGIVIQYAKLIHPSSSKSILLSPGRTEGYLKYKELSYDLYQQGYSLFIIDHRGQGLSGRMAKNSHKGHVESFQDYVTDLKTLYDSEVAVHASEQNYLVCHSMGGAIGLHYLLQHPNDFVKAVFASPMLAFNFPFSEALSEWLLKTGKALNNLFSEQPWYALGQTNDIPIPYALNTITQSKPRYDLINKAYEAQPQTKLGGVTFNWLSESVKAIELLQENVAKISTPFLVMQSGNDKVINNQGQDVLCASATSCVDGKPYTIPGAYHELFMEQDKYRIPAINRMLDFIEN
jgi:lysophospholipase